jgi:hypothetical protein
MLTRRLLPLLEKHKVLQTNQFAFLPGRGTTSELIQLINVLEEIQESNLMVDLSTSDVRGAFDSPERTAQYACWRRIGMPKDIAFYLTNLGAMSSYRLTSPYGMRKNLDPAVEGVDAETDNPWIPGRGGTQGDPLSTLGWVAFFDILLKALNVVQVKYPFYIRHSGSMLLPQRATCYADDTHGISPFREATDLANCISSAFAGMFGIAFHPEKLRAITTAEDPGVMTLYDWNWTPIIKEFGDTKAFITSLGVSYNLRGDSLELFNALRATLGGVAGILSRREASTMARTLSQKTVTTPQFLYPTQFYKLSENQLDSLTALLLNPLRAAKIIGTRLHAKILTNPALGQDF